MVRSSDYIQQLADYLKKNIKKGYTLESLKWALINQGYSRSSIEKASNIANEQLAKEAPIMKEKPVIRVEFEPEIPIAKESFWQKIKSFFV